MKLTKEAFDYVQEQLENNSNGEDQDDLVIAVYQYTVNSWSGMFCQEMVQLAPRKAVLEYGDFEKMTEIEINGKFLDIFVANSIAGGFTNHEQITIDARVWKFLKWQKGELYLRK